MDRLAALLRNASLQALLAASLLSALVALRIADPAPVAQLRTSVFDSYLRAAPRVADPSFPVVIVAIDEASLARIGQWPWPRTKLADLVAKLSAAGARAIAFDVLFSEPDRLSPDALAKVLGDDPSQAALAAEIAKLPSNDDKFAAAILTAPVVLGFSGDTGSRELAKPKAGFAFAGDDPARFVPAFSGAVSSLPSLADKAAGAGAVNWLPSRDQIVRRAPLLVSVAGELQPSLALEALRVGAKQPSLFVKASGASGISAFGQQTGIEYLRVGETIIPTDGAGEMQLNFASPDSRRTISAHKILEGAFNASDLAGHYVFIGATAAGLLDLRATPLDAATPGVEIHAQALEQMLSGDHLIRPAYALGAELAFLVIAGALVTWLLGRAGAIPAALLATGAIALVVTISWLAYKQGLLLDAVYPSISLAALYLATSLATYVKTETDRARVRAAFGHYLAPSLVEELARDPSKLKLGGETRVVTLLFADVRGFSRLSEGLDAEGVVGFVNRLFTPLSETILNNRGTIDKFIGDAVMAFWNAPADDANHAANACRAALAMLADVDRLNAEAGAAKAPVRIGVGLNTGPCVVGNVGSPGRFDYSVIGDAVNVASRFEQATKEFGASIVIGEATAAAAPTFAFLELGRVTPRGKDRGETIFALVGDEAYAASADFRALQAAHVKWLIARKSREPTLGPALAECRRLAPPAIAAMYQ